MRHALWVFAIFLALHLVPIRLNGQAMAAMRTTSLATNAAPGQALSERVVAYVIDARVDTVRKTVDATESLSYKNLTGQPLTRFPFHLYLNAFRADSTFTSETRSKGGSRDSEFENGYPARKVGSITISKLDADGFGDLTERLHFVAPDDGNVHDRTVAELELPRAIAPGETITFHMGFHDQFPESVARNGYKRDFLMGGQWYPKLGVFWQTKEHPKGAWNCHQYHATTEFFSDFGTFSVRLTLPRNYTVGASGVPTGTHDNVDGTRTLTFYGEDIHDFAWAASPHFTATNGTYLSSMGPVQVHVLALAEHPHAGERYLKILLGSLAEFDRRYGPYPYKMLTLIDPEPDSEIGEMEYPTLITGSAGIYDPTYLTEITAEHEFGHQYWYGMVATNEFEDAWLDEGINSYTEANVMASLKGEGTSAVNFGWANMSDMSLQYLQYMMKPDFDPVTRAAWQFRDTASYGGVTYGKSATLLKTLEGIVGADTMDEIMRTWFQRYKFRHPTTEDFLQTIEEVAIRRGRASGMTASSARILEVNAQDQSSYAQAFRAYWGGNVATTSQAPMYVYSSLRPFLQQAVYGTAVLDYALESISSDATESSPRSAGQRTYRNIVTVKRVGDFTLPVTVELVFANGSRVRERWDGIDRWHTFTSVRDSEIVSAEIDPDHVVLLDVDRLNNSRTVTSRTGASRKLTTLWLSMLQLTSELATWLI